MIPQGESRQLPDEIAAKLVAAHPDKLYYAKEHEKVRGPKRRRGNRRRVYVVKTSGTEWEPLKRATWTLTGSGSSQICQPPFG